MVRRTLLLRILPAVAVATGVLTLVVVTIGVTFMRAAVLDRGYARAAQLSVWGRSGVERLMRTGNHANMREFVEQVARTPDVAAARLLGADGVVRRSSQPMEVGRAAGRHAEQQSARGDVIPASLHAAGPDQLAVHVLQPLVNGIECQRCHAKDRELLGLLDVDVAVNPHMTGLLTFSVLSGSLGLLYVVAVVAIVGPMIAVVVQRPIRLLVSAMERVQAGDLTIQAPQAGTSEIDDVVDGFNRMVAQLRQSRAAEEEARRLQLARVEQLASVGELAAGLAHEIRNPLSSVKAVVEVIAEDPGPPESSHAALRDAASELSRIDSILRELLQYARPRPPAVADFDLNALARDAATLVLGPAVATGAQLDLALDAELPEARGDADMVRQVLVNLLLNAQQAAPAPDQLKVAVSSGAGGGLVWCRVRDNGPGIRADRAEAVFRPFVTTRARGTGLGLPISRRLAEIQAGSLVLENPGKAGASFVLTLPAAPARQPGRA